MTRRLLKACAQPEVTIRVLVNCYERNFALVGAMDADVIAAVGFSIHPIFWPTLTAMFLLHLTLET